MQRKSAFSRRIPDLVTEELVSVLMKKGSSFEFKQLFDVVFDRLKKRNAASGGEEMLRLRAYEKLQHLVSRNMVKKNGKKYKGLASLVNAIAPEESFVPPVPVAAAKAESKKVAVKTVPKTAPKVVSKALSKGGVNASPAKKPAAKATKPAPKKAPAKKSASASSTSSTAKSPAKTSRKK